jgi:probable phosphoglycerate mutase
VTERYPQRGFIAPPDSTTVTLLRHGASQEAEPGKPFALVGGRADPPLADAGVAQAALAAERLARERIDALFVTPLQRTAQTAAPLVERVPALEPVVVDDLAEVMLGEWEAGEFRIRAHRGDPLVVRMLREERWDVIPGAETMDAFAARVARGLAEVVRRTGPGRHAVAVVHGGVIGEICRAATGSRAFAFVHADNCSLTRLVVFAGGQSMVRAFNDVAHLHP